MLLLLLLPPLTLLPVLHRAVRLARGVLVALGAGGRGRCAGKELRKLKARCGRASLSPLLLLPSSWVDVEPEPREDVETEAKAEAEAGVAAAVATEAGEVEEGEGGCWCRTENFFSRVCQAQMGNG